MLRWSEDDESKSLLLSVKVRESEVSSSSVDASLSASDASDVNGDDVFPTKEVALKENSVHVPGETDAEYGGGSLIGL